MSDHDVYLMDCFMDTVKNYEAENLSLLQKYEDEGWLRSQIHPVHPLRIYNYTEQTQFEGKWDDVTTVCRGLVTEIPSGRIVAKPFPKFFNIEEKRHVPTANFEVFEKIDGSLGIVFLYNGEPIIATRGSFTSEQANKGYELLDWYYENWVSRGAVRLNEGWTYLFEIVYPANRVVVHYPDEKLVLLGAYDENHEEVLYSNLPYWPHKVKKFDGLDYQNCQDLNWENAEGFVVRFDNGSRCKIKFTDYCLLHKIMTCCSTRSVFECVKAGKNLSEVLAGVPDEFYQKIRDYANTLICEFDMIEEECNRMFYAIKDIANRKKYAEQALSTPYSKILFNMKDGKEYKHLIWDMIEPTYERL